MFPVLCSEVAGADGGGGVVRELTAGLATPLTIPAKLGMLASEQRMLSKLEALVLAAGTGVVTEAFTVAAGGLATLLAASARLGM